MERDFGTSGGIRRNSGGIPAESGQRLAEFWPNCSSKVFGAVNLYRAPGGRNFSTDESEQSSQVASRVVVSSVDTGEPPKKRFRRDSCESEEKDVGNETGDVMSNIGNLTENSFEESQSRSHGANPAASGAELASHVQEMSQVEVKVELPNQITTSIEPVNEQKSPGTLPLEERRGQINYGAGQDFGSWPSKSSEVLLGVRGTKSLTYSLDSVNLSGKLDGFEEDGASPLAGFWSHVSDRFISSLMPGSSSSDDEDEDGIIIYRVGENIMLAEVVKEFKSMVLAEIKAFPEAIRFWVPVRDLKPLAEAKSTVPVAADVKAAVPAASDVKSAAPAIRGDHACRL
jgi:hypothetical protein